MSWFGGMFRRKAQSKSTLDASNELIAKANQAILEARFALSQTNSDNQNHWADADSRSARSSLTPEVRKTMRERSRLEAENNSWYAGILATVRNHIVGTGPRLQVTTGNTDGNARLEKAWASWTKAVGLTEKLGVSVESDWRDGEVYLMRGKRPALGVVGLDVLLFETEQCHEPSPGGAFGDPYQDDGIRIDPHSNEIEYWFADHHPTDPFYTGSIGGKWYSARNVIHLFRKQRPGQLHGYPRFAAGLPLLAVMRRFEMATVHAAEAVANVALYMKTPAGAYVGSESAPFTTAPTARNVMMLLPDGCDLFQPRMENPNSNLDMYIRNLMMNFLRSGNVPLGLGIGTSKDSNFSSFKGDIRNIWAPEVKAQQERLTNTVLEVIFGWFLEEVVYDAGYVDHLGQKVPGVLDGMPPIDKIDHQWFWDALPPLDELDAAMAAKERIASGQSTLPEEYANTGRDYETSMAKGAAGAGVTVDVYKSWINGNSFKASFVGAEPQAMAGQAPASPFTELGQRAWNNNQKRVPLILDRLLSGEYSEARARIEMQKIGESPAAIQGYIDDARDGVIDTPAIQPTGGAA